MFNIFITGLMLTKLPCNENRFMFNLSSITVVSSNYIHVSCTRIVCTRQSSEHNPATWMFRRPNVLLILNYFLICVSLNLEFMFILLWYTLPALVHMQTNRLSKNTLVGYCEIDLFEFLARVHVILVNLKCLLFHHYPFLLCAASLSACLHLFKSRGHVLCMHRIMEFFDHFVKFMFAMLITHNSTYNGCILTNIGISWSLACYWSLNPQNGISYPNTTYNKEEGESKFHNNKGYANWVR